MKVVVVAILAMAVMVLGMPHVSYGQTDTLAGVMDGMRDIYDAIMDILGWFGVGVVDTTPLEVAQNDTIVSMEWLDTTYDMTDVALDDMEAEAIILEGYAARLAAMHAELDRTERMMDVVEREMGEVRELINLIDEAVPAEKYEGQFLCPPPGAMINGEPVTDVTRNGHASWHDDEDGLHCRCHISGYYSCQELSQMMLWDWEGGQPRTDRAGISFGTPDASDKPWYTSTIPIRCSEPAIIEAMRATPNESYHKLVKTKVSFDWKWYENGTISPETRIMSGYWQVGEELVTETGEWPLEGTDFVFVGVGSHPFYIWIQYDSEGYCRVYYE